MKARKKILTRNSRRDFVKSAAGFASGIMIIPRHVLGGRGFVPPSDKVNVGVVGVGGRGKENVADLLQLSDVQITAIADPAKFWDLNKFYYRTTAGYGPVTEMVEKHYAATTPNYSIAQYDDFRKMLETESALDAILCATPDHLHAYVSLLSMHAGKHVYCEKPLTHNIWEARAVQSLARETGLATQMGNQMHSRESLRSVVEYLKAGVIGPVREVHSWVPASRWIKELDGVPKDSSPVPQDFNWDLWLGPRSTRPFNTAYAPVTWRDFWEFGCGALGDFGCHDMDTAVWGLDLPAPESIEVHPAGYSDQNITPYGEIGYYQFPANGDRPAVKLTWYSGGLQPALPEEVPEDFSFASRGAMYMGDDGLIITGGREPLILPEAFGAGSKDPPASLPPSNGHHRDWIDAIKGGPQASSNFEYAAHLTEITLLGVLSLRLGGKKIYWDSQNMQAKGLPAADEFIREPVRAGWEM